MMGKTWFGDIVYAKKKISVQTFIFKPNRLLL